MPTMVYPRSYLWVLMLVVAVGGIWYPKLGYFLPIVFATLIAVSPFRGRWFCGNLCPRGSFNDFILGRISRGPRVPKFMRSMWLRVPVFAGLMGFMVIRLMGTQGAVDKIGMVFVTMCIVTSAVALLLGVFISPRAWCIICPMGTLQRFLGSGKHQLKLSREKCVDCGRCAKACPMQFKVNEELVKPDCIKCGRCVSACSKNALGF